MAMSGEINNLELRDPHADRRLLEFLLSVPEPMYRRNGVPRSFARAVLADRLPREIVTERRIGVQGVTWFRDLSAGRNDIAGDIERLEASPLASRLLDLPRLKQLMRDWPPTRKRPRIACANTDWLSGAALTWGASSAGSKAVIVEAAPAVFPRYDRQQQLCWT